MRKKHADDVAALTVNLDMPERRDNALAFLRSAQIHLTNLAADMKDPGWEKFLENVSVIPHIRIYDRQGKLVYDESALHRQVEEKVAELLRK